MEGRRLPCGVAGPRRVLIRTCVADAAGDERALRSFERLLMLSGEHTWGWNGGHIRERSWSNAALQQSLATDAQFRTAVDTWIEQRATIRNAVDALPATSALRGTIDTAFRAIDASTARQAFDATGLRDVPLNSTHLTCGGYHLGFGADGALHSLVHAASGRVFADGTHPLLRLWYNGLGRDDYRAFVKSYVAGISSIAPELAAENLYKPNLDVPPMSANASLVRVRTTPDAILLDLTFPPAVHEERGAPATAQAMLRCTRAAHTDGRSRGAESEPTSRASASTTISYELRWHNKTACHAPETIWLSSVPALLTARPKVLLDKLGSSVDATDADLGCDGTHKLTCGAHLHTVGEGGVQLDARQATVGGSDGAAMRMVPLDSALVSVGPPSPFPTPLARPDTSLGVHFALVGNIWNTNYPFWYPFVGEDNSSTFRFEMTLEVEG